MYGIVMLICAVVIMVRVAEAEDRSTLAWGGITLALCLVCDSMMPTLIGVGVGLALSFMSMFVLNVVQD